MNVKALRVAAQKNGTTLQTQSTNRVVAEKQLSKWGTTGTGAVKGR